MTLPIDRSTLALAQGNQVPYQVASATKNINFLKVVADTIDELNEKVDTHASSVLLPHTDGSVSTTKMADLAVTTPKLAPQSVTNDKVANASLTADKFVPGALTNDTQNALRITALQADVVQRGVNVKSYGAIGDGITDDTLAIRAAKNAVPSGVSSGGTLYFPDGTYKTTDTISINKNMNVIMDGVISYAGPKDRTALYIKSDTDYFRYNTFKLNVLSATTPTAAAWDNAAFIGIYMESCLYCNIRIDRVSNFSRGFVLAASVNTIENEIHLGQFRDNKDQLVILSVLGGAPNANNFYDGSFERSGNVLLNYTGTRTNISFLKSSTYGGNALYFKGPRFEGGATITAGLSHCIYIEDLFNQINFADCRVENVIKADLTRGSLIYLQRYTANIPSNIVFQGWNVADIDKVVATDGFPVLLEDCKIIAHNTYRTRELFEEIFDSGGLADHYKFGLGGGTRYGFDNCFVYDIYGTFAKITSNTTADNMNYSTNKLISTSYGVPSVKFSCAQGDHFKMVSDGRYMVSVQDLDGNPMNMPLGTEIIGSKSGSFTRNGAPYIDRFLRNTTAFDEAEFVINDSTIGYIIIGACEGNSYFKIYKYKGNGANTFPINNNFYSSAIPSGGGNHEVTDKVLNSTPTASSTEGWICTTKGTYGTLSSVTGSITTGTKILTVNDATNIKPRMYITIVGVSGVKRVTRVVGTTVYIDSNASATVSGAAVAYATPVYKTSGVTGA